MSSHSFPIDENAKPKELDNTSLNKLKHIWEFDLKTTEYKYSKKTVYFAVGIGFVFWLLCTVKVQLLSLPFTTDQIRIFHMVPEIPFADIDPLLINVLIGLTILRVLFGFSVAMLDLKYFTKMSGKPFDWIGMINISCTNILIYGFAFVFIFLTPAAGVLLEAYGNLLQNVPTLFNFNGAVAVVAACVLGDFCFYWSHRLSHNMRLLWNLGHIYHHRHQNLTQFHFAAEPDTLFLRASNVAGFLILPLITKLFTLDVSAVGWSLVAMMVVDIIVDPSHSVFLYHVENRFKLMRWLRYVFVTAAVHYTHHSKEVAHNKKTGCNFAARFTFWDRLFGTYVEPSEKLPETGLFGNKVDYCNNPIRFILLPYYRFYLELKRNKLIYWPRILFGTTSYAPPNKAKISH